MEIFGCQDKELVDEAVPLRGFQQERRRGNMSGNGEWDNLDGGRQAGGEFYRKSGVIC